MSDIDNCPQCEMENCYSDGTMNICPDCGYEWNPEEEETNTATDDTPRDSNGTELLTGDSVIVIKNLPVKGSSMVIKKGTKVKNIRLTDDPREVDCKVEGSSIVLKTCFLKKS